MMSQYRKDEIERGFWRKVELVWSLIVFAIMIAVALTAIMGLWKVAVWCWS